MKLKPGSILPLLFAAGLASALVLPAWAAAPDFSFTYQGRLKVGGGTPDPGARFDFRFTLFDMPTGGIQLTDTITQASVPLSDGLLTVPLDFGSNVFTGPPRWLEIEVRPATNNPTAPYAMLSPRQKITPTPYAVHANRADLVADGSVRFEQLAPGAVGSASLQNGVVVRSVNGLKDDLNLMTSAGLELITNGNNLTANLKLTAGSGIDLTPIGNEVQIATVHNCGDYTNCYWNLLGNGNIASGVNFLGTVAGELDPLEFRVNNTHAMRIVAAGLSTPNIIGGHSANSILGGIIGTHIGGGGEPANFNVIAENYGTIGGGSGHSILSKSLYAVIGGGYKNTINTNSSYTTIGGGDNNTIRTNAPYASIGGGQRNTIEHSARHSTIGGGVGNSVSTNVLHGFVGGGTNNAILTAATSAAIVGGAGNSIQQGSTNSAIGGGLRNLIQTSTAQGTISGGADNAIQTDADNATIGGGSRNVILPSTTYATIPGGLGAVATNYGQLAYASGFFGTSPGEAQLSLYVLRRSLPTAATLEMFLDGDTATRRMYLRPETTWTFDVLIAARNDGGSSAGYRITGVIKNSAGVTALVGVPIKTVLVEEIAGWDANVSAASDALTIMVTGDMGPSRWVATVRTSEVLY